MFYLRVPNLLAIYGRSTCWYDFVHLGKVYRVLKELQALFYENPGLHVLMSPECVYIFISGSGYSNKKQNILLGSQILWLPSMRECGYGRWQPFYLCCSILCNAEVKRHGGIEGGSLISLWDCTPAATLLYLSLTTLWAYITCNILCYNYWIIWCDTILALLCVDITQWHNNISVPHAVCIASVHCWLYY